MAEPSPTTVGELAIYLTAIKGSMDREFAGITAHLEKLDGLPMKVQAIEYKVEMLEQRSIDRRLVAWTVVGWLIAIAGLIAGVVVR